MDEDYGRKIYRLLVGVVVVAAVIAVIWFANRNNIDSTASPQQDEQNDAQLCDKALSKLIVDERNGVTVDGEVYDEFSARCPAEYSVWADYQSIRVSGGSCSDLAKYRLEEAAIELARRDGLCAS